jgi:1-acyl-sn-glycerol-3-phosphate acyltransferase
MTPIGLAGSPARNGHVTVTPDESEPTPSRFSRAVRGLAAQGRRRLPDAGLDQRDPDFIRERLPLMWLISSLWFRGEVRGLGNLPDEGPVLLVGNHSGGTSTPDTLVFTIAFNTYFGVERAFYQLAEPPPPALPWLRRFGAVSGTLGHAARALQSGAAVLVYPGGCAEAHRPSWRGDRIDLGADLEFIRLATRENVPIVPVVAIGGQETALFLSGGEGLARLLRLDRLLGVGRLPVSLALPWGINVGDLLGHLPLPAKITIEVLPAVDPHAEFGEEPEVRDVHDHLVRSMQAALNALADERQLPVIG